jgi:hypothetical protein
MKEVLFRWILPGFRLFFSFQEKSRKDVDTFQFSDRSDLLSDPTVCSVQGLDPLDSTVCVALTVIIIKSFVISFP